MRIDVKVASKEVGLARPEAGRRENAFTLHKLV